MTTPSTFAPSAAVAELRERIDHPIIDGDGHVIEFLPLVLDFITEVADSSVARRFEATFSSAASGPPRSPAGRPVRRAFWALPAGNTLDRATAVLPELLYHRLDELGLDFVVLYPTEGLSVIMGLADDEVRQAAARALNRYYAECYGPYRDRLAPVAVIPTVTPDEAVDELNHAVGELGLRAAVMGAVIPRTAAAADGRLVPWIDTLGHDSAFDYDPLWARCAELGVAPTFHASGVGTGTRASTRNYVYNHLGAFAVGQEAACRALVLGGVVSRFPALRFGFLEGGVSWACQLFADLIGHFEKRNRCAIDRLDPATLDRTMFAELFGRYATGPMAAWYDRREEHLFPRSSSLTEDRACVDDFAESGIESVDDIVAMFRDRLYFGCEADDPLTSVAFDERVNPQGTRLNPFLSSDIGHWDVVDMRDVVAEAWELVENGQLTDKDFRRFACTNAAEMFAAVNPDFFGDTAVEADLRMMGVIG